MEEDLTRNVCHSFSRESSLQERLDVGDSVVFFFPPVTRDWNGSARDAGILTMARDFVADYGAACLLRSQRVSTCAHEGQVYVVSLFFSGKVSFRSTSRCAF